MTTSIDVLRYLRGAHETLGKMQRQKLLYYAQAWHLTWFGGPLFEDPVQAWEMGPVTYRAWKADMAGGLALPPDRFPDGAELTSSQKATVDAIYSFYGSMSGQRLSMLTHNEYPWKSAYEDVSPIMRGSIEIKPTVMRRYYSIAALRNEPHPAKPQGSPAQHLSVADTRTAASNELPRWIGVMKLLADR